MKRTSDKRLPRAARLTIALIAVGGAAVLALRARDVGRWTGMDLLVCVGLALAIVACEQFPLVVRHRTERQLFTVTDVLWVGGLILVRPSVLIVAVAAGFAAVESLSRLPLYKVAFNAGQFVLSVTAAQLVFGALHNGGPAHAVTLGTAVACLAGMVAYFVCNSTALAMVIAQVERRSLVDTVRLPIGFNLGIWAGNVALGLLGVVIWTMAPGALPLMMVPVIMAYLSYRGYLRGSAASVIPAS